MTEQKFPEVTVGALIFNQEKKVFLMKSHKWKNKYVIPGGHVELGETLKEALKREIKEETNLDIFDINFIISQEFIYGDEFYEKRHFIFFNFVCETNLTDVVLNDEAQEFVWVTCEEALKLPIEPYSKKAIEIFLEKFVSEKKDV